MSANQASELALSAARAEQTRKKLLNISSELLEAEAGEGAWMVGAWAKDGGSQKNPQRGNRNPDTSEPARKGNTEEPAPERKPVSFWA
jgi:hypothetical protein